MKATIKAIFGTSPLTTILGYLVAAILIIQPLVSTEGFDIKRDWLKLVSAVIFGIWGRAQKDSNGVTAKEGKAAADAVLKEDTAVPKYPYSGL